MSHYYQRGRTQATCHPERFVKAHGLCSACEAKARYAMNPQHFRNMQRAQRLRSERGIGALVLKSDPDTSLPRMLWGMRP